MRVLGFDIDESTGRSACGTVRVCSPASDWRTGYHVHVKLGPVSVQGVGPTLALAESSARVLVADTGLACVSVAERDAS